MWHYSTCNNVICSCIDDDDLTQHTVIIGMLLAFRKRSLQALKVVLERRIPFMFSINLGFKFIIQYYLPVYIVLHIYFIIVTSISKSTPLCGSTSKTISIVPPQEVHPLQESYWRARKQRTKYLLLLCVYIHVLDLLCSFDIISLLVSLPFLGICLGLQLYSKEVSSLSSEGLIIR